MALLAGQLPAADRRRLEPLGQGEFYLAFRLGNQIVRVARHPEAAVALRREACVLVAVANRLPLPVPRPTYYQPSGCPPFSMHDEVVGTILTRDNWIRMPAAAREKAARDLAAFLRTLHTIPTAVGLECGLMQFDSSEYAHTLREAASAVVYPLLNDETQQSLDATLTLWSFPAGDGAPPRALLHCDIAPGHLLCDESTGRLTGVIDFGDIALGDPARDFIYIYEDYGPAILADVLSHYSDRGAPSLLPEIRKWYLLEVVAWTLDMLAGEHSAEVRQGLAEIKRELTAAAAQQRPAVDGAVRRS
jgi:aminoglycoside 2''-phosphotransferase